jgi:hypothetical protein
VITDLKDISNDELINPHNPLNCPPFVTLCAMYPVFRGGASYTIYNNGHSSNIPNLTNINSDVFVCITDLALIDDNDDVKVYPISYVGYIVCQLSLLRKYGWI